MSLQTLETLPTSALTGESAAATDAANRVLKRRSDRAKAKAADKAKRAWAATAAEFKAADHDFDTHTSDDRIAPSKVRNRYLDARENLIRTPAPDWSALAWKMRLFADDIGPEPDDAAAEPVPQFDKFYKAVLRAADLDGDIDHELAVQIATRSEMMAKSALTKLYPQYAINPACLLNVATNVTAIQADVRELLRPAVPFAAAIGIDVVFPGKDEPKAPTPEFGWWKRKDFDALIADHVEAAADSERNGDDDDHPSHQVAADKEMAVYRAPAPDLESALYKQHLAIAATTYTHETLDDHLCRMLAGDWVNQTVAETYLDTLRLVQNNGAANPMFKDAFYPKATIVQLQRLGCEVFDTAFVFPKGTKAEAAYLLASMSEGQKQDLLALGKPSVAADSTAH